MARTHQRIRGQDRVPFPHPPSSYRITIHFKRRSRTDIRHRHPRRQGHPRADSNPPRRPRRYPDQRVRPRGSTILARSPPPRHRGEEDPFNVDGPDYEWPGLDDVDRDIMGITRATAWEFRRRDVEDRAVQRRSRAHENPWPYTSPFTGANPSTLPTPCPYPSAWSATPTGRYGTPPQGEGYLPFGPELLKSRALWNTPFACIIWQKLRGAPERPCEFPRGYAARYDLPGPLPTRLL